MRDPAVRLTNRTSTSFLCGGR